MTRQPRQCGLMMVLRRLIRCKFGHTAGRATVSSADLVVHREAVSFEVTRAYGDRINATAPAWSPSGISPAIIMIAVAGTLARGLRWPGVGSVGAGGVHGGRRDLVLCTIVGVGVDHQQVRSSCTCSSLQSLQKGEAAHYRASSSSCGFVMSFEPESEWPGVVRGVERRVQRPWV